MRLILLCFVLFQSALSNEESDEKYIDLLPEEEKRQFLEKIARRILEDYHNTKKPNVSDVEMTEDDLDAHSSYVQGLLKEETKLLRDGHNESQRRDTKDDQVKEDKNDRKISVESENSFKDLTLRTAKREKRRNDSQDPSAHEPDVIPVLPLYDDKRVDQKIFKNNVTTKSHSQKTTPTVTKRESSKMDDLKITTPKKSTDSRKLFVYEDISSDENYERNGNITDENKNQNDDKVDDSKVPIEETNAEDNRPEDDENVKSTVIDNFEPSTIENTEESSKEKSVEVTNAPIVVRSKDEHIREGDLARNGNDQINFDHIIKSTDDLLTLNPKEVNTIKHIASTPHTETTTGNAHSNISSKGLKLIDIDTNVQITTKSDKNYSTKSATKTTVPFNTTSDLTRRTFESTIHIVNKTDKIKETKRPNSDRAVTFTRTTKPLMSLTTNSDKEIKRANSKELNDSKNTETIGNDEVKTDGKERLSKNIDSAYYVYEISAEKPPFRSIHDQEQPYYAPVYNYDPEFAYYNPSNRFGPNTDDLPNQDSVKEKSKRRNRFRNPYSVFHDQYKFNMFNILKHQNPYTLLNAQPVVSNIKNYNPNDYIDMDYFFGRNEDPDLRRGKKKYKKVFPESNENDHPYQSMKNSLQGHIRAVRKLLYAHKHFGYLPDRPRLSPREETLRAKDFDVFDHNDKNKKDITLDYYFGRQNSHEVDSDNLFKLKLSELNGLLTVTPNPVEEKNEKLIMVKEIDTYNEINVDSLIRVLKDMVQLDNEALVAYDWLGSTVDIQSALNKLKDMTIRLKNSSHIHPNDLELLKYVIYLYKSTKEKNETTLSLGLLKNTINKLRKSIKKKSLIPKIKKKSKKFSSAIQMWKDFRTFLRTLLQFDKTELIKQFQSFLAETQFNLNGLHEAITNIADVTTYKNQNWYGDLKNIYLKKADKRMLLEVILHLSLSRLLGLIEESSSNGLEESFTEYVKKNRREVEKARNEFKMVLRLLNEFKKLN